MKTEKQEKISKFNRIMQATCSGSMKGSYQTVYDIKHMCEDVIGEYVSSQEWAMHHMENDRNGMFVMKRANYEKALQAEAQGDSSASSLWANIRIYVPVTEKVFRQFYENCRNGHLAGLLK